PLRGRLERAAEIDRILRQPPPRRSRRTVTLDPRGELRSAGLAGRDEHHRPLRAFRCLDGKARLAAARAADQERERHQKSIPRRAFTPRSKAWRTLTISVTVSATARSEAGASRPVAITFTRSGRSRIAATTSSASIQPQFIG